MGSSVTIVTTLVAMAPGYTVYCPPVQSLYPFYINSPLYIVCQQPELTNGGNFTYTGILQGAQFGFQFMGAVQDGDVDQIYNITSGQSGNAIATCNTTLTTNMCSTPTTYIMTGNAYELETFASSERNYTTGVQDSGYNYSIIVLPPVPAQPIMFIQYTGVNNVSTGSLVVTSSRYSSEYGSAMTGCLLHYGATPYQPPTLPTTLSSSSSAPANSVKYLSSTQNVTQVVTPASFTNAPISMVGYDYHFTCNNGNGWSPEVILYNVSVATSNTGGNSVGTSSTGNNNGSNPNPSKSSASRHAATNILSTMVGLMGAVVAGVTLLV